MMAKPTLQELKEAIDNAIADGADNEEGFRVSCDVSDWELNGMRYDKHDKVLILIVE